MMSYRKIRAPLALGVFQLVLLVMAGCAIVDTGATVVKAGASVVGTTVSAASAVATTTVHVGLKAASTTATVASATVSAASAAKAVSVAAAGTAVAAGSFVVSAASNASNAKRADEVSTATVFAAGPDRFSAQDGRLWLTKNCPDTAAGQPALWVAMRSGETEIRGSGGRVCFVVASLMQMPAEPTPAR